MKFQGRIDRIYERIMKKITRGDLVSPFLVHTDTVAPSEEFLACANIKTQQLYEYGNKNRVAFWEGCAHHLHWNKKWNAVLEWDAPFAKWFEGGRLNVSYNCLDRHMQTSVADKIAFFWEGEKGDTREITYRDLYQDVNKLASALKSQGIKKGDTVAIYLPMIPEAIVAMQACSRLGALHVVVFAGFSAESLKARILDANAKILITADVGFRRQKQLPLKEIADSATEDLTCLELMVVIQREKEKELVLKENQIIYEDFLEKGEDYCQPVIVEADDPLFILYTSGTTGRPKGIVHSSGGYLVGAHVTTRMVFDVRPQDVFWCTADIGWITGHTYVAYGPLSNGMTQVMYEGAFDCPAKDRIWQIIEKYKVTTLYTAPTAIRQFMKWGEQHLSDKNLDSLRLLGSVGEPLNPEAWWWYYKKVGKEKCPIVDTWWQTETGSIMMTSLPALMPMKPGCVGKPLPGIEMDILDDYGNPVDKGYLAIMSPWPSMLKGIHGDTRRFVQTYWNKWGGRYYFAGDGAAKDEEGYWQITGRVDDTLNVAAHRIGSMEVESALIEDPFVAESAVIGVPDEITGQAIIAFVVLREGSLGSKEMEERLKEKVVEQIGAIARPKKILFVLDLPKTRSGKIMRRLLKDLALGRTLGDMTTLEDPQFLEILESHIVKGS